MSKKKKTRLAVQFGICFQGSMLAVAFFAWTGHSTVSLALGKCIFRAFKPLSSLQCIFTGCATFDAPKSKPTQNLETVQCEHLLQLTESR
jgi:hypothetical protein